MMMKADEDHKIQELLDQKMHGKEDLTSEIVDAQDLRAYEVLYGHLKQDTSEGLSLSFQSNLLRRIDTERKRSNDTRFYFFLGFVILFGILAITAMSLVYGDALATSFGILHKFKGLIAIAIAAIIAFSVLELKLNRARQGTKY